MADSYPIAIRLSDIHKSFGAVQANRGASLEVRRGEIHALVGENGAGKSTLMRVLSGMYRPDAGHMEVDGRDVTGWSTTAAIAAGVGMVHQHFMLVPTLTVAENIMLGRELTRAGQLDAARAQREVSELSRRTGLIVRADARVSELSVGEAQRVEILKTLYRGARILILDEPTAVLSPPEIRELWSVLRGMRDRGETIVLITHKLDEVMEISDTVTVMRQGRTVDRLATAETTPAEIARAMVGRDVALAMHYAIEDRGSRIGDRESPTRAHGAEPRTSNLDPRSSSPESRPSVLAVQDLVVQNARGLVAVDHLSLEIAAGEIVGIAGVEGNGQTELVEAIAGLRPVRAGQIRLGDRDLTDLTVRDRGDAGLSHIPEDRQLRGLILDYSVADNLILGQQHHFTRGARLDRGRILVNARRQIDAFDIRPGDPMLPARALSGGNQQKIVIAREMTTGSGTGRSYQVLLAAQPTRGVDVGAIEFIHDRLREARDLGRGILLVSADLSEILALSDRIGVMYSGRLVAVLPRSGASAEVLGSYMTGATSRGERVS